MTSTFPKYDDLDSAICNFLATSDGHPTNDSALLGLACQTAPFDPAWYLISFRLIAMRKAGRIKFVGSGKSNPSGKTHGWVVCTPCTTAQEELHDG
jgi:hypothetical protein